MKKLTFVFLIGGILGACSVLLWVSRGSIVNGLSLPSTHPVMWSWKTPLTNIRAPVLIEIDGRIWSDVNGGIVAPPVDSLNHWKSGIDPAQVAMGAFRVTDGSVLAIEWWTKMFSGGQCRVIGTADIAVGGHLLLTRIDSVELLQGISTTIDEIIDDPARFHGLVLHTSARVVGSPRLPGNFVFSPDISSGILDRSKGVKIEFKWASPITPEGQLLFRDNETIELDALYHRPWKGDPDAPAGRFVAIHRVAKGTGK